MAALQGAFKLGQLRRAVHARHLQRVGDAVRLHRAARCARVAHHVGEVVLALGIALVQLRQPGAQQPRRGGHDAAVDFVYGPLRRAGVFVLDDGLHAAVRGALDAPVAARVGQAQREQRQLLARAHLQQGAQRGGLGQGHIAREHQRHPVVGQQRQRLLHRVAGAQLGLLAHAAQCQRQRRAPVGQRRLHLLGLVPGHHHRLPRLQLRRLLQHVCQQGLAPEALQHLGPAALHARALAGCEHHHVERKIHLGSSPGYGFDQCETLARAWQRLRTDFIDPQQGVAWTLRPAAQPAARPPCLHRPRPIGPAAKPRPQPQPSRPPR